MPLFRTAAKDRLRSLTSKSSNSSPLVVRSGSFFTTPIPRRDSPRRPSRSSPPPGVPRARSAHLPPPASSFVLQRSASPAPPRAPPLPRLRQTKS
eukprot:scaffold41929_cov65-Phaeocystis_antarctica.AAC.2